MAATADSAEPNIPDFCSAKAVLAVVLIAELVAIVLTLADRGPGEGFLLGLSTASMFLQWLGLTSAVLLCQSRNWLTSLGRARGLIVSFVLLQVVCLIVSECAWWLNASFANFSFTTLDHLTFQLRNFAISAIVSAMALRYFYVAGEWRRNVELESRARIRALQARIRPHFLFNSMNTIAALTRSDPNRAEEAIEDLADLFRATLGDSQHHIPMKEELEVAQTYQRMEQLRLGERLQVDWEIDSVPMQSLIPGLTIQPLLENAINHGIEPLPEGGRIHVFGEVLSDERIRIVIKNPVASENQRREHRAARPGHQMALENIRQRFELAYGKKGSVIATEEPGSYAIELLFPASPQ